MLRAKSVGYNEVKINLTLNSYPNPNPNPKNYNPSMQCVGLNQLIAVSRVKSVEYNEVKITLTLISYPNFTFLRVKFVKCNEFIWINVEG